MCEPSKCENYYFRVSFVIFPCEFSLKVSKPRGLKVRRYANPFVDLNEYLDFFPGATLPLKIGVNELNDILINSLPNSWSKQAYVQGFDRDCITFFLRS